MSILSWIILGLVAGAVAKFLLPGRDPGGLIVTTLIGIAGSFVGGWLSSAVLHKSITKSFSLATFCSAVVGALVLLIAYRIFFGNSRD